MGHPGGPFFLGGLSIFKSMQTTRSQITCSALERKCFQLRLLAFSLWAIILLVFSLVTGLPNLSSPFGNDKILHAIAYGIFAFLLARLLHQWYRDFSSRYWQIWVLTMVYGGLLEGLQFVTDIGRRAEWHDLIANGMGALLACVLMRHTRVRKFVQARMFPGNE